MKVIGTGLYWVEGSSDIESFDLFANKTVDSVSWDFADDGTFSTFIQHGDLYSLHEWPNFYRHISCWSTLFQAIATAMIGKGYNAISVTSLQGTEELMTCLSDTSRNL